MPGTKIIPGTYPSGIPYVKFGTGPKAMLFFAGGPGNTVPTGLSASGFVRGMRALTVEYTITLVTRKSNLPEGYTTKDMADDYAELIRSEFGGHVNLIMGASYGGMLAQHFAANYPGLFDHLVIVMSGPVVSAEAKQIDLRYAELLGQYKDREAMVVRGEAVFTGAARFAMSAILWLFGKSLLGQPMEPSGATLSLKPEPRPSTIHAMFCRASRPPRSLWAVPMISPSQ